MIALKLKNIANKRSTFLLHFSNKGGIYGIRKVNGGS